MEKALEILKRVSTECEAHENFMGYAYEANKVDRLIDRAIAELEEAMKPKTCEGCRYGVFGVNGLGFEVECRIGYNCSRGREDRYEPKDNK